MRASGVLLPVFSLPSPHGIGCFSKEAYEWVDFLKLAGQQYWQILPLGPTSYGDSPYQSFSTYAGNPYFIDLEELVEAGFLTRKEVEACDCGKAARDIDELVSEVTGMFAGGRLSDEALDGAMKALNEAYWIAKEKNKKYSPKKYRKRASEQ